MYNYLEQIKEDVRNYINEEINLSEYNDYDVLELELNDTLWVEDSVTGNASGSYTFNRYQAQEYVMDNIDLLNEACEEFGIDAKTIGEKLLNEDFEWVDITIRCYLLSQAINEVIEELQEEEDL